MLDLLALRNTSAPITDQIKAEDVDDRARRRILESKVPEPVPHFPLTCLICQTNCAFGTNEVVFGNSSGVNHPAVVSSNHQQVDLRLAQ